MSATNLVSRRERGYLHHGPETRSWASLRRNPLIPRMCFFPKPEGYQSGITFSGRSSGDGRVNDEGMSGHSRTSAGMEYPASSMRRV